MIAQLIEIGVHSSNPNAFEAPYTFREAEVTANEAADNVGSTSKDEPTKQQVRFESSEVGKSKKHMAVVKDHDAPSTSEQHAQAKPQPRPRPSKGSLVAQSVELDTRTSNTPSASCTNAFGVPCSTDITTTNPTLSTNTKAALLAALC